MRAAAFASPGGAVRLLHHKADNGPPPECCVLELLLEQGGLSHACRPRLRALQVKNIMVDNIERVLERGEKIELLVDKTDNLRFQVLRGTTVGDTDWGWYSATGACWLFWSGGAGGAGGAAGGPPAAQRCWRLPLGG